MVTGDQGKNNLDLRMLGVRSARATHAAHASLCLSFSAWSKTPLGQFSAHNLSPLNLATNSVTVPPIPPRV
jgi:hypothetical protein